MRKRIPKLRNPFWAGFSFGDGDSFWVDAESRLDKVKRFSTVECRQALRLPDLQKTVRIGIERRLRRLQKEAA